jgi:hypothetical protein
MPLTAFCFSSMKSKIILLCRMKFWSLRKTIKSMVNPNQKWHKYYQRRQSTTILYINSSQKSAWLLCTAFYPSAMIPRISEALIQGNDVSLKMKLSSLQLPILTLSTWNPLTFLHMAACHSYCSVHNHCRIDQKQASFHIRPSRESTSFLNQEDGICIRPHGSVDRNRWCIQ